MLTKILHLYCFLLITVLGLMIKLEPLGGKTPLQKKKKRKSERKTKWLPDV